MTLLEQMTLIRNGTREIATQCKEVTTRFPTMTARCLRIAFIMLEHAEATAHSADVILTALETDERIEKDLTEKK